MDSFLIKQQNEQEEVEELLARIQIQQNCAFSFYVNLLKY
jgi:hypothetical protein